ncbi:YadA-like family protein [Streptobacillus moniliformis]|uniref:YadA-like family protein n=1 Tax=Streptobacillus moniliformis TaxID=34105 RepID=UPI0007E39717|nr:YadA-like family protein [Streptobacillus moniliformis]
MKKNNLLVGLAFISIISYADTSSSSTNPTLGNGAKATGEQSTAVGINSNSGGKHDVSIGTNAQTNTGTNKGSNGGAIAIGANSKADGDNAFAIGNGATAEKNSSMSFGGKASGTGATNIGYQGESSGDSAVSIGYSAKSKENYSTAIGGQAEASKTLSTAIGSASKAKNQSSTAIGANSEANYDNSIAIGASSKTDSKATQETSVTVGSFIYSGFAGEAGDDGYQVSVGIKGMERQIKNVASGKVSKESTDAINGSQLFSTNNALSNLMDTTKKILGGNSKITKSGETIGNISMTDIGGTKKDNINDAIKAAITEVNAENNSAVSVKSNTGPNGNKVYTLDVKVDNKTIIKGKDGILKANIGTITTQINNGKMESKTDDGDKIAKTGDVVNAVNGLGNNIISFGGDVGSTEKQTLNKTGGMKFNITGSKYITTKASGSEVNVDLSEKVKEDIEKGVSAHSGVASAVAMANLPQVSPLGGHRHNIAGSYGFFNGEHAFALGISGLNEKSNLVYRASGSLNTKGHISLGAGLGYQFDKLEARKKDILTLQRNGNINMLDEKVYEHELKIRSLEASNKELRKELEYLKEIIKNLNKNI